MNRRLFIGKSIVTFLAALFFPKDLLAGPTETKPLAESRKGILIHSDFNGCQMVGRVIREIGPGEYWVEWLNPSWERE